MDMTHVSTCVCHSAMRHEVTERQSARGGKDLRRAGHSALEGWSTREAAVGMSGHCFANALGT